MRVVTLWTCGTRYYAGYSAGFVEQALQESAATAKLVLDPWNDHSRRRQQERTRDRLRRQRLSPEHCEQRVARLHERLGDLRARQAELSDDAHDMAQQPTPADLTTMADRLDEIVVRGEPEKAKALLRLPIAELRVNCKTDIQPTYRVLTPDRILTAGVCETSGMERAVRCANPTVVCTHLTLLPE
jgi:hypothetical protein